MRTAALSGFDYAPARSIADALDGLGRPGAMALAGGTDLVREMRRGTASPVALVGIARLEPLRRIESAGGGALRIGAAATLSEIAEHPVVRARHAALARACAEAASAQIRNLATIGGNLCQKPSCWYYRTGEDSCVVRGDRTCAAEHGENEHHGIFRDGPCCAAHPSDPAPALVALGAVARIASASGERALPVEDLFRAPDLDVPSGLALAPGELVLGLDLPPTPPRHRSLFLKARERRGFAFALASVAAAAVVSGSRTLSGARVAASGVGPAPVRLRAVEAAVEGRAMSPESAARAGDLAVRDARPLARNGYKVALLKNLVAAALAEL